AGRFELLVAPVSKAVVNQWLEDAERLRHGQHGVLGITDTDEVFIGELTAQEREREVSEVKLIVENVNAHCADTTTTHAASVPHDRRDLYANTIGLSSLHSICSSRRLELPLWTDDYTAAIVGQAEFGVQRVWTQAVAAS